MPLFFVQKVDINIDCIYDICISNERISTMARTTGCKKTQINISIPTEWKTELENLARIYSVEEGRTVTFLDLMRRGIQEKYQLGVDTNEQEEGIS